MAPAGYSFTADVDIIYLNRNAKVYAVFHYDNKIFSPIRTKFSDDFAAFYKTYTVNKEKHSHQK